MEHTNYFEKIKIYYDKDLWNKERIYNVIRKKYGITKDEYE